MRNSKLNKENKKRESYNVVDGILSVIRFLYYGNSKPEDRIIPTPKLNVSVGTLIELEKWAEKARVGETKSEFLPVWDQIKYNGDNINEAIKSLTLTQIMPYDEMLKSIKKYKSISKRDRYDYLVWLAKKYATSIQNVVDRFEHVKKIKAFLEKENDNSIGGAV